MKPPKPEPNPRPREDDEVIPVKNDLAEMKIGDKFKRKTKAPQEEMREFWDRFFAKFPGIAYSLLPKKLYAKEQADAKANRNIFKGARSENAERSYDDVVAECRLKVKRIVEQCRRVNVKFVDSHFDIELDKQQQYYDCLMRLSDGQLKFSPGAVKRIPEIFDNPQFYGAETTTADIRQGMDGDCWFIAATCILLHDKAAIDRVCVARDEAVGVYGFVFFRDGEWFSEIIDDKLYLAKENYNDLEKSERDKWNELCRKNPEKDWREQMQKGSAALYFAQCRDEQATWLPLLEKAYAKAHGDFSAINGGHPGEALEDLTGGVTNEIGIADILDKERFWYDELQHVNERFLFSACAGMWSDTEQDRGILYQHSYSVLRTAEVDGVKLLKLRNPWGKTEWEGPWSDGSEEWTPERMVKLNHKFGNDGVFWIPYHDFCNTFGNMDRTRLFGKEWSHTQIWTSVNVPWTVEYLDTKFTMNLARTTSVVIVLSQLDNRYFYGLEGPYYFYLQFRLHRKGVDDYIVRSRKRYHMRRSVNAEVEDLEPGDYSIRIKIFASRTTELVSPQDAVQKLVAKRRHKLLQVGLQYELAHAKGHFPDKENSKREKESRKKKETKRTEKEKQRQIRMKSKLRRLRREHRNKIEEDKISKGKGTSTDEQVLNVKSDGCQDDFNGVLNGVVALKNSEIENETESASDTKAQEAKGEEVLLRSLEMNSGKMETVPKQRNSEVIQKEQSKSKELTLADVSDDELSWDSEVDGPFEDSDNEDGPPGVASQVGEPDALDAEPWNAVAVLGLRVYAKDTTDGDVKLAVTIEDTEEDEKAPDLDDSARCSTLHAKED